VHTLPSVHPFEAGRDHLRRLSRSHGAHVDLYAKDGCIELYIRAPCIGDGAEFRVDNGCKGRELSLNLFDAYLTHLDHNYAAA
jgi:hypothetical protein